MGPYFDYFENLVGLEYTKDPLPGGPAHPHIILNSLWGNQTVQSIDRGYVGSMCGFMITKYKLLFSWGFYFREFRESNPRENFHFYLCLFIVMTTSAKSRN